MAHAKTQDATECPVAPLVREAQIVIAAFGRADERKRELNGAKLTEIRRQLSALDERREGIEERASHLVATSGLGALFQVHVISVLVSVICSHVPDDDLAASGASGEMEKSIRRMLYSLQDFIATVTGDSAEDAGADYYMRHDLDPHGLVDAAIAEGMEGGHVG